MFYLKWYLFFKKYYIWLNLNFKYFQEIRKNRRKIEKMGEIPKIQQKWLWHHAHSPYARTRVLVVQLCGTVCVLCTHYARNCASLARGRACFRALCTHSFACCQPHVGTPCVWMWQAKDMSCWWHTSPCRAGPIASHSLLATCTVAFLQQGEHL